MRLNTFWAKTMQLRILKDVQEQRAANYHRLNFLFYFSSNVRRFSISFSGSLFARRNNLIGLTMAHFMEAKLNKYETINLRPTISLYSPFVKNWLSTCLNLFSIIIYHRVNQFGAFIGGWIGKNNNNILYSKEKRESSTIDVPPRPKWGRYLLQFLCTDK